MRINIQYLNCSRPPEKRIQVETTYRDKLLEFFDTPEKIKKCSHVRKPFNDWSHANAIARQEATKGLTQHEKDHFEVSICFEY